LGFLLRIPSIFKSLKSDEALIAYYALKILHGSILYRDLFEPKPPGLFFIVALAFWIFGKNIIVPRIVSMFISCLTGLFLFLIGKKIRHTITGLIAALLFVVDPLAITYGIVIHAGSIMTFFMVISVYFYMLTDQRESGLLYFFVGMLIGVSALIKQPGILTLPIILVHLYLTKNISKDFLKSIMWILCGVIIIILPFIIYFLITNALYQAIFAIILFNISPPVKMTPFAKVDTFFKFVFLRNPLIWIIGGTGLILLCKFRKKWGVLIVSWFGMSFLLIVSLRTPWDHYYIQVIPPLCLSSSILLQELFSIQKTVKLPILKIDILKIGTCLLLLVTILYGGITLYTNPRYSTRLSCFSSELEGQYQVASYIVSNTAPEEKIFATHAAYYFLTDREAGYKFAHLASTTIEAFGISDLPQSLEINKVRYLVLDKSARTFIFSKLTYIKFYGDEARANEVGVVWQWILEHYFIERIFHVGREEVQIYRSINW